MKSFEIRSRYNENGVITIYKHISDELLIPVYDQISQADIEGSTCLMTQTNDEALQMVGLLKSKGLPARLIQSFEGFNLLNLYEVRYVLGQLGKKEDHQTISDERLKAAVRSLKDKFGKNSTAELVTKAIKGFVKLNPGVKYRSDFENFVAESNLEDFIDYGMDTILVSTMHKAKGREFDNVYLMLNHFLPDNNEKRRLLYVAMTRAKKGLEVHYNNDFLDNIDVDGIQRIRSLTPYPKPDKLLKQLTHKDVYLGYFEFIQQRIHRLHNGDSLKMIEEGCLNQSGDLVMKFSESMKQKLGRIHEMGYSPTGAKVSFRVYWYNEEKQKEYLVMLPMIGFKRSDSL
jgi:ATP-dependent DNA helicase RecQ